MTNTHKKITIALWSALIGMMLEYCYRVELLIYPLVISIVMAIGVIGLIKSK